jgi:hypothetical protein
MAKKTAKKRKPQKQTPASKRKSAGRKSATRSGARPAKKAARKTGRKKAGAKSARPKSPPGAKKKTGAARSSRATGSRGAKKARSRKQAGQTRRSSAKRASTAKRTGVRKRQGSSATATRSTTRRTPARGGTGHERGLAQTPEAGRTVKGPTNPMPTKRSTGTPAGAGTTRHIPGLDRQRRQLRELEEELQTPPSSLDMDRMASAARTGRAEMRQARREHTESSPVLTGGDVDANWAGAYAEGDEAPGGDNPTPDQDRVDDIGKALGVTYEDNEELKASDKIAERDRHRWELDPASSEDYRTRDKDLDED